MAKAKLGSGKRFKSLEEKIESNGYGEKSSKAIAASIGRKKYGPKTMAALARKGKKKA